MGEEERRGSRRGERRKNMKYEGAEEKEEAEKWKKKEGSMKERH
jgi:hypothetical protein